jgi:hypothetical protein
MSSVSVSLIFDGIMIDARFSTSYIPTFGVSDI